MEILFRYYGIDWLSMLLSILAMVLLGNKVKLGFILFAFANLTMIVMAFYLLQSIALVAGNAIFLITNTRGFLKWNAESRRKGIENAQLK
jgi:hypothetical protein